MALPEVVEGVKEVLQVAVDQELLVVVPGTALCEVPQQTA
jgi:hypothetical protein